jgi:hypothetical protein
LEWQSLVQDKKTTEIVVAMYDSFELAVKDSKYAKIYKFSNIMHP